MMPTFPLHRLWSLARRPVFVICTGLAFALSASAAEPKHWNRDNPNRDDVSEGLYRIPYQKPTRAEIVEVLHRVRAFLETAAPTRVVDSRTGAEITDRTHHVATATLARGPGTFNPFAYEMGVVHSGMLRVHEVTGDAGFRDYTARHMQFFHEWLPYFRDLEQRFQLDRRNAFHRAIDPRSLDDSGSMCAALIRAARAGVGPDNPSQIEVWAHYILNEQFRFPDGTLARQRPQPQSLWADDAYMSIPALAEMGHRTGERKWFDDAVRQSVQMYDHLYASDKGVLTHGLHLHNPKAPRFFWARANGWVVVAMCDLLDVLPREHPGFEPVRSRLENLLHGLAEYQDGNSGLWHQMLDRNNSYLETSASAMFTYGLARAVNQGWISPTTYGSIALAGWIGVTERVNRAGQVEGTCVGTTLASDQVYYYHRPQSVYALHGYGPVLLAGAEIIRLLENPAFEIQHKLRTYHFVPTDTGPTSYREHE
jgi:unsaturated rhamnogalacturonyl hydrolase